MRNIAHKESNFNKHEIRQNKEPNGIRLFQDIIHQFHWANIREGVFIEYFLSRPSVEEHRLGMEASGVTQCGAQSRETAGMSSEKVSENLTRRKPKGS